MTRRPEADELRRLLRDHAGLEFTTLIPADGGESRTVFRATDRANAVSIVKILPGGADAASRLRTLDTTVSRLRDRGYPTPWMRAVGQLPGLVFWVQERISGDPLDQGFSAPDHPMTVARFLPELIRLNDAQAGLGTGDVREWPALIRRTLASGGDG